MDKKISAKHYIAISFAMLFFALSFVWFKVANQSYGPLTIVFFRLVLSAAVLFLFNLITKKLTLPSKRDFKLLLLLAVCEPFIYFMGESFALEHISSTLGAVITSTIPLVALVASFFFFHETISKYNIVGIFISLIGVLLVVYETDLEVSGSLLGISLQLIAVVSAVAYTIVFQKISRKMNIYSIVMFQNLLGSIYFLPLWIIFEMKDVMAIGFDSRPLIAIAYLSFFASTVAFLLYTYSTRVIGILKTNTFTNAIPVFTAIAAWFILGEKLSLQKFVGIAIVITGLFLAQMKIKRRINGKQSSTKLQTK